MSLSLSGFALEHCGQTSWYFAEGYKPSGCRYGRIESRVIENWGFEGDGCLGRMEWLGR